MRDPEHKQPFHAYMGCDDDENCCADDEGFDTERAAREWLREWIQPPRSRWSGGVTGPDGEFIAKAYTEEEQRAFLKWFEDNPV